MTILRSITIKEGAIIGTSEVVTKDVDAYSIVEDVSAKIIKERNIERI